MQVDLIEQQRKHTPLRPAGHLPLKEGDRQAAESSLYHSQIRSLQTVQKTRREQANPILIYTHEGETSGRTEVGEPQTSPLKYLPFLSLALLFLPTLAHAGSPLGIGTAEPSFEMSGPLAPVMLWINIHQAEFYRALTGSLRDMRENTHALWTLIGLSFAYGVFHAAGPGHGKAVISSYMIANELELKRGIVISIISSLLQGFVAIATVGIIFLALRGSGITLTEATNTMETASFALVVLFGLWLLFRKLREIWRRPRLEPAIAISGPASASLFGDTPALAPRLGEKTGLRFQAEALDHEYTSLRDGDVCIDCGRSHLPDPRMVSAENFNLKEAWSAIMAVGLRPCSGALLVMTFSMLNSLYLGGILSVFAMSAGTAITVSTLAIIAVSAKSLAVRIAGPGSKAGHRVGLAIELGGALFVILIGSLLLAASLQGYHMSSL